MSGLLDKGTKGTSSVDVIAAPRAQAHMMNLSIFIIGAQAQRMNLSIFITGAHAQRMNLSIFIIGGQDVHRG
ncbi:hypothetical protein ACOMHN_028175 [Nucella lapillus]